MEIDPDRLTIAGLVLRAAVLAGGDSGDGTVELVREFEDDRRPAGEVDDASRLLASARRRLDPGGESPELLVAGAVASYLASHSGAAHADRRTVIGRAVRSELGDRRPPALSGWLEREGIAA